MQTSNNQRDVVEQKKKHTKTQKKWNKRTFRMLHIFDSFLSLVNDTSFVGSFGEPNQREKKKELENVEHIL